jgi:NADPH:quinone reductase-like Zn-dependent oxidoreductase
MSDLKIQSAIIMKGPGEAQVMHDLSTPSPDLDQLLIRTYAVALNSSDWMALGNCMRPGTGLGYDFSGEVVKIGQGVQVSWNIGDRVAGFVHGCENYSVVHSVRVSKRG